MNKYININGTVIKTQRLILRPFKEDDLFDFNEYARVDGVGQMAGWMPHKNMEESKKILDMFMAEAKTFAIEYRGKVIGSLGIEEYDDVWLKDLAPLAGRELGFVLSKEFWGQGMMPEAVNSVIEYAFTEYKLDFLICGRLAENRQSGRVQEKCGFIPYAVREKGDAYGVMKKHITSILTKEDWLKGNIKA